MHLDDDDDDDDDEGGSPFDDDDENEFANMEDAIYRFPVGTADGGGGPDADDIDLMFHFPEGEDNSLHTHALDVDARAGRGAVHLPLWSDMGGKITLFSFLCQIQQLVNITFFSWQCGHRVLCADIIF